MTNSDTSAQPEPAVVAAAISALLEGAHAWRLSTEHLGELDEILDELDQAVRDGNSLALVRLKGDLETIRQSQDRWAPIGGTSTASIRTRHRERIGHLVPVLLSVAGRANHGASAADLAPDRSTGSQQ